MLRTILRLASALAMVAIMAACGGDNNNCRTNPTGPGCPLTFSVAPATVSIALGGTTTLTTANGTAPFNWNFSTSGLTANCGNASSCTFTGVAPGTWPVQVNDVAGHSAQASITVQTGTQVTLRFKNDLGSPVAGASVQVIGIGQAVATNSNGEATVTVPSAFTLFDFDVSLTGYATFREKYTGATTEFVLTPLDGYDETFLKEFVYGDNSRGLGDTTGIHPFQKLQSPSVSWIPNSDIVGDAAAMANLVQVGQTVSGDLGGLIPVDVSGSGVPARSSLDENLTTVGYTTRSVSGGLITGADVKFKNLVVVRDAYAAGHELLRVMEFGAHSGPGLLGNGGSYHMSPTEIRVAKHYLTHRNEPGWQWAGGGECSPRRVCQ